MMRRQMVLVVFALVAASVGLAAQKADFSGTWVLDPAKSEVPRMGGGMSGRGGGALPEMTVVIRQTGETLQIEQKMRGGTRTLTYKLDGSESTNPGMRGNEVKSTSKWEGNTIVTEGAQTMSGPNGEVTVKAREVRSLAADGTMIVETTRETPRGEMKSRLVFRKST